MVRQLAELEAALQQQVAEHRKLLGLVEAQYAAMRAMDLAALDAAMNAQEACRLRIATLEAKRRGVVQLIGRGAKVEGPVTLAKIAALFPQRRDALFQLRDELKSVAGTIATRTKVSAKVAGAVLGHLNTVVRLLAGAVERAGVYTKDGIPQVSRRIGVMEAVG